MMKVDKPNDRIGADSGFSAAMIAGFIFAAFVTILVAFAITAPDDLRLGLAKLAAFVVTPFILEPLIFVLFFSAVVLLNRWRLRREGDEWVYLVEDANAADAGQKPGIHDAVFSRRPEDTGEMVDWEIVDGLIDLGSYDEAVEVMAGLAAADLDAPRGLRTRLRLAELTGKSELAEHLKQKLADTRGE